jgi:hypothetical protein
MSIWFSVSGVCEVTPRITEPTWPSPWIDCQRASAAVDGPHADVSQSATSHDAPNGGTNELVSEATQMS